MILGQILTAYREAVQFNQDEDDDGLEIRVAAWLPITSCIPVKRLFECYVHAMQNRQSTFPLSAQELIQAWRALQDRHETYGDRTLNGRKLLAEHAAGACQRCWGRGMEEMPDGSVRPDCQHLPLTEDEIKERAQAKSKMIAQILRDQAETRKARLKAESEAAQTVKDEVLRLICDGCKRKSNTSFGWQPNEQCGSIIGRDNQGEVILCSGRMVQN